MNSLDMIYFFLIILPVLALINSIINIFIRRCIFKLFSVLCPAKLYLTKILTSANIHYWNESKMAFIIWPTRWAGDSIISQTNLDSNFLFKNNGKFGDYNFNIKIIEDQTWYSVFLSRNILWFMFHVKHKVYVQIML